MADVTLLSTQGSGEWGKENPGTCNKYEHTLSKFFLYQFQNPNYTD